MERLWTPWRLPYVTESSDGAGGCIFCDAQARISDDPLVVHRGRLCFVILNKYPYNNGHLMIVPRRHVARLVDLDTDELVEFAMLTQRSERVLTDVYSPHGFNMGLNLGKPAGAGVLYHLHMHIVPRWNGDTNFMTVVGETRVLPEELGQAGERVRAGFARIDTPDLTTQISKDTQ
jgi:ATP adenylyltransferase